MGGGGKGGLLSATPREAASVLLLRRVAASPPAVYMIRRAAALRFLGGFYAFPGGVVEGQDYDMAQRYALTNGQVPDRGPARTKGRFEEVQVAHQVAAARELFEECNILLVKTRHEDRIDKSHLGRILGVSAYRELLLAGEMRFLDMLEREGLEVDLAALHSFARWVTPEGYPTRYDTRYFAAWFPEIQAPDPFAGEIEWEGWVRPGDALEAASSGEMPMVLSTVACLQQLQAFEGGSLPSR